MKPRHLPPPFPAPYMLSAESSPKLGEEGATRQWDLPHQQLGGGEGQPRPVLLLTGEGDALSPSKGAVGLQRTAAAASTSPSTGSG